MKKLLFVGAVGVAVFAFVAIAKAQDVGFEGVFDSSVSVDLKVNGQDGPITVEKGSRIVVSWISEDARRCRGNWSKNDIKLSGTVAGKISKSAVIKVACIDREGNRDDDSVVVNVAGGAVIQPPTNTLPPQPITPPTSAQPSVTRLGTTSALPGEKVAVYVVNFPKGTARYYVGFNNKNTDSSVDATLSTDGSYLGFIVPNLSVGTYNVSAGVYGENGFVTSNYLPFTITAPTTSTGKPLIAGCGPLGDVNNDGVISSADTDKMSTHILGTTTMTADEQTRADVNKSDSTTTLDKALINGYIIGTQTTFPGCTTASTQPSITSFSLNGVSGNNIFAVIGSTATISWTSNGARCSTYGVVTDFWNDSGLPASGTSIFVVPSDPGYRSGIGGLTLGLQCWNVAAQSDTAQLYIKTVPPENTTIEPKITITQPNGGEILKAGETKRVIWTSNGIDSNKLVTITLVENTASNSKTNIASVRDVLVGQGYVDFPISSTVKLANNYTFEVFIFGQANGYDKSDSYFTITAPTTSTGKPLIAGCGPLGDVNNDGVISSADTDKMSTHILGTTTMTADEQTRADVNKSDSTTTLDKALINGYIIGTQTTFPGCTATTTSSTVNQLAGAGIPESDVWGFVKAFFGGR